MMRSSMLGTGLIGDFYTKTLHGQRSRDRVRVVYSRSASPWRGVPRALGHPGVTRPTWPPRSTIRTRTWSSSRCPNFLHEEAIELVAKAGKAVLCTKPLGRTAEEARRMLDVVERRRRLRAAISRTCATRPRRSRRSRRSQGGAIGDVTWVRSRETHPGPHSRLVLGRPADRRRRDHRPGLPLHRDHPQLRRQGESAGRGPVPHGHARPPHRRRGQRDRADPLRVRGDRPVRGQLDVPRRDGPARRGGRHARHDLDEPLPAHRASRCSRPVAASGYVAEKAETSAGWLFPVGDEVSRAGLRGHVQRHVPCHRIEGRAPQETFYDGYVVNAIMDAALPLGDGARRGSRSTLEWRGGSTPRIASTPETVRGPGGHQARDPARRPPQAHPQGPGHRRLQRPGGRGRVAGSG